MYYFFLIPHAFKRQILLIPHNEGFSLPRWTLAAIKTNHPTYEHQRALLLNQAVHDQFNLDTAVLLITSLNTERLVIFDTLCLSGLPLHTGRWVSAEELTTLPLTQPCQRAILETWFAKQEEEVQHTQMPWQRRGWFVEAAAWITRQLDLQGYSSPPLVGAAIHKVWSLYASC